MLPKHHRLKREADIRRTYRQGRCWHHPLLTLYAAPTATAGETENARPGDARPSRFAVSISRRVGNAVVRNRCKRLVREALRARLAAIEPSWDYLFVARNGLAGATFAEVEAAVCQLLRQADLFRPESGPKQAPTT